MFRIKNLKHLTVFVTAIFIISTWIFPKMVYSSGFKFGIISVVQDRVEELKEKLQGPPNTPETPSGTSDGLVGVLYTFSTCTTDPNDDEIQYCFDWGDGSISEWTAFVNSGSSASKSHSYSSAGSYSIKAQAKDTNGAISDWSGSYSISITSNQAPNTPKKPSGPSVGSVGISYTFTTSTTDPNGDEIQYCFGWGDGNISEYSSLINNGSSISISHSYSSAGAYYVKVQAKDNKEAISDWSSPHSITISVSEGTKKWEFQINGISSSPAIDSDGTIYIVSADCELYAINPDGTKKWEFQINGISSSPAIDSDGTIYIVSADCKLYAINPDGTKKWERIYGVVSYGVSSPVIGSDGTIYVKSTEPYPLNGSGNLADSSCPLFYHEFNHAETVIRGTENNDLNNKLYAIHPDGTKKWEFTTDDNAYYSFPAVGTDGTIYVGAGFNYPYNKGSNKVYAINSDGTKKWEFVTDSLTIPSPVIGSDGTIYIGSVSEDNKVYAINPDGTKKWESKIGGWVISSPSIGSDGTIYIGSVSEDNKVYAINPDGAKKWEFQTDGDIYYSPVIDTDGIIYVGARYKVYAINPDGTKKWEFTTGGVVSSSPAVGSEGTIYVGAGFPDYKLYAIYGSGN